MKKHRVFLVLAGVLFLMTASASWAGVVIIANKSVSDKTLSKDEAKDIFLGKKTKWSDGKPIHFVIVKDPAIHESFLRDFINKTPSQFDSFWKNLIFTGKGRAPTSMGSAAEVVKFVTETEGAVGYVDDKSAGGSVTTVTVQ